MIYVSTIVYLGAVIRAINVEVSDVNVRPLSEPLVLYNFKDLEHQDIKDRIFEYAKKDNPNLNISIIDCNSDATTEILNLTEGQFIEAQLESKKAMKVNTDTVISWSVYKGVEKSKDFPMKVVALRDKISYKESWRDFGFNVHYISPDDVVVSQTRTRSAKVIAILDDIPEMVLFNSTSMAHYYGKASIIDALNKLSTRTSVDFEQCKKVFKEVGLQKGNSITATLISTFGIDGAEIYSEFIEDIKVAVDKIKKAVNVLRKKTDGTAKVSPAGEFSKVPKLMEYIIDGTDMLEPVKFNRAIKFSSAEQVSWFKSGNELLLGAMVCLYNDYANLVSTKPLDKDSASSEFGVQAFIDAKESTVNGADSESGSGNKEVQSEVQAAITQDSNRDNSRVGDAADENNFASSPLPIGGKFDISTTKSGSIPVSTGGTSINDLPIIPRAPKKERQMSMTSITDLDFVKVKKTNGQSMIDLELLEQDLKNSEIAKPKRSETSVLDELEKKLASLERPGAPKVPVVEESAPKNVAGDNAETSKDIAETAEAETDANDAAEAETDARNAEVPAEFNENDDKAGFEEAVADSKQLENEVYAILDKQSKESVDSKFESMEKFSKFESSRKPIEPLESPRTLSQLSISDKALIGESDKWMPDSLKGVIQEIDDVLEKSKEVSRQSARQAVVEMEQNLITKLEDIKAAHENAVENIEKEAKENRTNSDLSGYTRISRSSAYPSENREIYIPVIKKTYNEYSEEEKQDIKAKVDEGLKYYQHTIDSKPMIKLRKSQWNSMEKERERYLRAIESAKAIPRIRRMNLSTICISVGLILTLIGSIGYFGISTSDAVKPAAQQIAEANAQIEVLNQDIEAREIAQRLNENIYSRYVPYMDVIQGITNDQIIVTDLNIVGDQSLRILGISTSSDAFAELKNKINNLNQGDMEIVSETFDDGIQNSFTIEITYIRG